MSEKKGGEWSTLVGNISRGVGRSLLSVFMVTNPGGPSAAETMGRGWGTMFENPLLDNDVAPPLTQQGATNRTLYSPFHTNSLERWGVPSTDASEVKEWKPLLTR